VGVVMTAADLRGARRTGVAVPLVLGGLDGAILTGIVVEGGPCANDCLAGAVLSALSPVGTPLRVAAGDAGSLGALTFLAVVVVVGLAAAWWWTVTGTARDLGSGARYPRATFWGCWLVAVAATVLLSAVTAAVALRLGIPVALVLELVVWAAVVLGLPRLHHSQ
jgi:hypothetical protein